MEIKLPDLGEGIESGSVAVIIANPGETVTAEDAVIELETDKAVVPVPAGVAGTIGEIKVAEGDEVKPGDVIAVLSSGESASQVEQAQPVNKSSIEEKTVEATANSGVATKIEFALPELGEGIEGGLVIAVLVQKGQAVKLDEAMLELETDKAVLPVPAPADGTIVDIKVKENDEVKVGQILVELESSRGSVATASPQTSTQTKPTNVVATVQTTSSQPTPSTSSAVPAPQPAAHAPDFTPASPAVRKLARELGVVLKNVSGSARGGRVNMEDLKAFVKVAMSGKGATAGSGAVHPLPPLPDFSKFGPIRKEKSSKLRSTISKRMSAYWSNIPHVHQFQNVDVTNLVELQKKLAPKFKEEGSALSVTQFLIKGLALGLKEFPIFNSSYDDQTNEVIYKDYFHVGVAVDTPSGLIVPVLKDVDQKSIFMIGKELKELAKKTRDRKVGVNELQGACITLSNLGGIGGTHFTPIINYPEVAILGAGRSRVEATWIDGEFKPRTILPLVLAYDHRVIDGADGARFIMRLTEYLENVEYHLMH